jgi:16S rRNA (cytosine1402-N4)-methyltransferase
MYHQPVLLHECLQGLNIRPDGIYVDVTFGGGGHSKAILEKLNKNGKLFAFDKDADAFGNTINDSRFTLIRSDYRFLSKFLEFNGVNQVDGILADLGVSSYQLDTAERGFSHRYDEAIPDMRMDKSQSLTAQKVLQEYSEEQLGKIILEYGEIYQFKAVARAIANKRIVKPFETLRDLKEAVQDQVPQSQRGKFFTKLFQAIRIEVNGELDSLKMMLEESLRVLKPGGRLVVMSYHSLEDRLVKNYIKSGNFKGEDLKDFYGNKITPWKLINKKVITASEEELKNNSRASSAKLRIAEKL